ncbi:MAG: choice-of-anchor Q domain-containing protein [Phycisphaerae bacterium]|jgi:hypothetical protein
MNGGMRLLRGFLLTATMAAMVALLLSSIAAAQERSLHFVDSSAEGVGDGSSWADAWTSLQTALDSVEADAEIWVAGGTYQPGGHRSDTFELRSGTSIRGGFAGDEDASFDLRFRDFAAHETVLSGEIGSTGPPEYVYHVVTSRDTDASAVLDGFTITGGRADGLTALDQDKGAGLLNAGGSPTVWNCVFDGNQSGSWGGAVHNACGSPTFVNCMFVDNRTTVAQGDRNKGGGVYSVCDGGGAALPILINCLFVGNAAGIGGGGRGGGYYEDVQSFSSLVNCTFTMNHADDAGGGIYGAPTVVNTILWNNRDRGGVDSSAQITGAASVSYSCVQGGWAGAGNLSDDPLFVGSALGELTLSSESPCIDAGNNATPVREVPFDLDGWPRIVDDPGTEDTGVPSTDAAIVDMGAFEFQPPCDQDGDCDDSDPCTTDRCHAGDHRCEYALIPCGDGVYCNGAEQCVHGVCVPGVVPDCDDGNLCTEDACDEARGSCEHVPDDARCTDGLYCNGVEFCDLLVGCRAGPPPDCDDGLGCTRDRCDEEGGRCEHLPSHDLCDNGSFCDGIEACDVALGCRGGAAPDCDDGVACTVDTCNETSDSCEHVVDSSMCGDGLFCNGVEVCDPEGGCRPGAPPCGFELCDEAFDACAACAADADCDDGVACTKDDCVDGGCAFSADDGRCADDGSFCNGEELCDAAAGCYSTGDPCGHGAFCDEGLGRCVECQSDAQCDDGDTCTLDGCRGGQCTHVLLEGCAGVDGEAETEDACPTDPSKDVPGICGCGVSDVDHDSDGLPDCRDGCPEDRVKIEPGVCGCGVAAEDLDLDGVADCIDFCPGTPDGATVDDDGCSLAPPRQQSAVDGDGDGVADGNDLCMPTQPGAEVDGHGCAFDDPAAFVEPAEGERRGCGVCGAFGMLTWFVVVMGWMALKANALRHGPVS